MDIWGGMFSEVGGVGGVSKVANAIWDESHRGQCRFDFVDEMAELASAA